MNPRSYRSIGTAMGPSLGGCIHCDVPLPRYAYTPLGWLPPSATNSYSDNESGLGSTSCSDTTLFTIPQRNVILYLDKRVDVGCGTDNGIQRDGTCCFVAGHQTVCKRNPCYNSCTLTSREENEANEFKLMNMLALQQQAGSRLKPGKHCGVEVLITGFVYLESILI